MLANSMTKIKQLLAGGRSFRAHRRDAGYGHQHRPVVESRAHRGHAGGWEWLRPRSRAARVLALPTGRVQAGAGAPACHCAGKQRRMRWALCSLNGAWGRAGTLLDAAHVVRTASAVRGRERASERRDHANEMLMRCDSLARQPRAAASRGVFAISPRDSATT